MDGTKHVYLHVDIENTAKNRGAVTILINGKKADLYDILKNSAGNYGIDDYNATLIIK